MKHALCDFFIIEEFDGKLLLMDAIPGTFFVPDACVRADEINLLMRQENLQHILETYGPNLGVLRNDYGEAHLMDMTFDSKFYFR